MTVLASIKQALEKHREDKRPLPLFIFDDVQDFVNTATETMQPNADLLLSWALEAANQKLMSMVMVTSEREAIIPLKKSMYLVFMLYFV